MEPTRDERDDTEYSDAAHGPTRMQPIQRRPGGGSAGRLPSALASDSERDAVLQRLREAFAEGRLNDTEFDERMRAALSARTHGDLEPLLTDLPASPDSTAAARPAAGRAGRAGRFAIALKSSVRRAGRWHVPEHYTTVVYKGRGELDLRAAELSAPVTTIVAAAYKSRIEILVSPGVVVQMTGFGVTHGEVDMSTPVPPDAPVLTVRGLAYKGTIEVSTKPRDIMSL
jgi:hypothetical protein